MKEKDEVKKNDKKLNQKVGFYIIAIGIIIPVIILIGAMAIFVFS